MASSSAFASGRDQKPEIRRRNVGEATKSDNVPTISISDTKGVAKVRIDVCANLQYILTALWQKNSFLDVLDEWEFVIAPIVFTALSFFTRMYRIGLSNIVTWDEAQYVYHLSIATITRHADQFLLQLRKIRFSLSQA